MAYEVHDGRILTWSLETHLVDHCNLRCQHCCTLSPGAAEHAVSLAELARDLKWAAAVLRQHVFKLTGGEPLLHPDILGCLDVVRESGIAARVSLTTNGFLLARVPEGIWERIDRLTLSWYASTPLLLTLAEERAFKHDVLLTVKRYDAFQRMTLDPPGNDTSTTRGVFRDCWLKVRCHLLYRGRFYMCTRPPHLEPYLQSRGESAALSQPGWGLARRSQSARPTARLSRVPRALGLLPLLPGGQRELGAPPAVDRPGAREPVRPSPAGCVRYH
jgi:cyclic pyranopterin phosphate synthase